MKNKLISFFRRILSVLVIIAVALSVFSLVVFAAASFDDILGLEDDEVLDFIRAGIMQGYGISPEGLTLEYFTSYYDYLSEDWWGLATGSGGVYNSDGSFNDNYLTACEQQVAMFFAGGGIPFNWDQFLDYAKARRSAELAGNSFSDDVYSSENDVDPLKLSGEMFKAVATDYSLMYAPMPTPSQYIYNYQSATGKKETGYGYHQFTPYAPVFRYGSGYGCNIGQKTGWTDGCYLLPFVSDDDLGSTYYSWGYWHFYHKYDDSVRYICADYISLSDGSVAHHFEREWNLSDKGASYGFVTYANYFALESFNSDTLYLQTSRITGDYTIIQLNGLTRDQFSCVNGKLTDLTSKNFTTLLQATTFTPQSNSKDDWGYIMSETPFELIGNQTQFDYDKIPDNYYITINGDNIYDYSITNPDTGKSTTINNYITNNYTIPDDGGSGDDPSSPDKPGSVGDVTVSGNIDVSGKIEIDTKPIDININVNSGSSSSDPDITPPTLDGLDDGAQGISDLIDYYQDSADQIGGFFSSFLSIVPEPIRNMIPLSIGLIIFLGLVHALRR